MWLQDIKYRFYIYGAILGILVAILVVATNTVILDMQNNEIEHTKTITIIGKICPHNLFGSNLGKIQDSDDVIYFIDPSKCNEYIIGSTRNISYHKIHQVLSMKMFDFNRVSGKYGGWDH